MASTPKAGVGVIVKLELTGPGGNSGDIGHLTKRLRFRGAVNTGYLLYGRVFDSGYAVLKRIAGGGNPAEVGYLKSARKDIYRAKFSMKWDDGDPPDSAMEEQTAFVIALRVTGRDKAPTADLEFVAIDPPSWFLNAGDASGRVYEGKVSDVIKQVIQERAPGIQAEVGETEDSDQNVWWDMRQDPKTFITSLLDWSSSLTKKKTQWMIGMDGEKIVIKPQADLKGELVAMYTGPNQGAARPHVLDYDLIADSALSIVNTKLVTHGIGVIDGQYFDRITDKPEEQVFVKDKTTPNKKKPKTSDKQAFTKPPDGEPPTVGWTSIQSVPEIYSAGDIGRKYSEYIDGRARGLFLNMANLIMRMKLKVIGHGVFRDCLGLGVDTIKLLWKDDDGEKFFMDGNWIVYGFEHWITPADWSTDVHCARIDHDAEAKITP